MAAIARVIEHLRITVGVRFDSEKTRVVIMGLILTVSRLKSSFTMRGIGVVVVRREIACSVTATTSTSMGLSA